MSTSEKVGKFAGKLVKLTKSAPKATGNKITNIASDFSEGYRNVVPTKIKSKSN